MELRKILIVDLYRAIQNDDPNEIKEGLSRKDFNALADEYMQIQKPTKTFTEQRVKNLETKINIGVACLYVLETKVADKDMMKVLNDNNFKIDMDNYPFDIIDINKKLIALSSKLKRVKSSLPKTKSEGGKSKVSIYDLIANMSANLDGIYLDPRRLTVIEFIAYRKVLERKSKSLKKEKDGSRK